MEEWLCPSHCLICLGKALTSNTNLNNSSGNLGSVSEARLGLAQWPSLREHGKFAGSICHRQHELRKRTRVIKWVGSTAGFSICREKCSSGCTMRLSEAASKWNSLIANACNFAKERTEGRKKNLLYQSFQKYFNPWFKGESSVHCVWVYDTSAGLNKALCLVWRRTIICLQGIPLDKSASYPLRISASLT